MSALRAMLIVGMTGLAIPALAQSAVPTLVPGSTYHYDSISPDFENSSFFLLYLGSVGHWNVYMRRSSYGDTDYYAEPVYGLDYVDCAGQLVTSPEDLASDLKNLATLPEGDVMNRAAGTETVRQIGPVEYTTSFFPGQTFAAQKIVITYEEEGESFDTGFTYTTDGGVGLEIDWGEGDKDVLTSFSIAATPAPPLSRQRVMELCPVLIDYYSDD
ncbi:hypothetical protein [Ponticaulis sp.]|uniref:hypothetical protein n=1 Tax=Ponticaulis sp. TaxID=2020902 RepID=UPI000C5F9688|nr:hypothetical protein [Ponticaulis sp.]MAJ09052.1 hypothetical protein [Ponticaulis sp.]RPG16844.1 MAG: hypothetical protein CBC85_007965 [Hyphomonadaceae bacterium TMED125]HBJ93116.1 hypothetical protein [Hyphomonadaceae bacterium]|tara:strand:- start:13957 stop:14601 length:645 start_codon:yes stop_codon:yes gene_type:complete